MENILGYKGRTLKIKVEVLDENQEPANLSGGFVKFGIRKSPKNIIVKDCTVINQDGRTYATVELSPEETDFTGRYFFEFTVSLNGEIDPIQSGILHMKDTGLPNMFSEEE
jgi:hypothetical protein